jgi:galactokinase
VAKFAQQSERSFLKTKTGLLDQTIISVLGEDTSTILLIDFKTLEYRAVKVSDNIEFVWIHSGLPHNNRDTSGVRNYPTRATEITTAAEQLGVKTVGELRLGDLPEIAHRVAPRLFPRVRHHITENQRALDFEAVAPNADLKEIGKLMSAGHRSASRDYDTSEPEIEALVSLLEADPNVGGAMMQGGGFGGAVVFVTHKGMGQAIANRVIQAYETHPANKGRYKARIIH